MSTPQRRERLQQLMTLLQASRTLSSLDIAEALHVSRRTVFRDIRELKSQGVNVVWSEESQAYQLEITADVPDFDPSDSLAEKRKMETVRVWFHEQVAPAITKLRWVSREQTEINGDGSIVVELRVSRFDDILRWLLSFGDLAKVLHPAELRDRFIEQVDLLRKFYDDEDAS